MRVGELPPWIPSPAELLAARGRGGGGRVHWLTLLLFVLAWAVAIASLRCDRSGYAGAFYPLAALAVCCAVVPSARARRWPVDARTAQAAHLGLASLTPWLVFAWTVAPRIDRDGDGGGALGGSALVQSSILLPLVLPATLAALRRLPPLKAHAWPILFSVALVAGLSLVATIFSARHPTADGLANYQGAPASFEPADRPGRFVQPLGNATLSQRRVGERCVTHLRRGSERPAPYLAHRCASPLRVHLLPGAWPLPPALFQRPLFTEMVFASAEGEVIGNKAAPRYLLYTAPLWEWIACALLGAALGASTFRRVRRTFTAWRALPVREGTAGDGVVRCDDGAIERLPDELAGHTGRVLVLGGPAPGAPFREGAGRGAFVVAAGREAWARGLAEAESAAMSFALAATWLPAAPLLASPLLGMLSPLP
ncbi:MAG: hypothetical protein U0324_20710 [Polyangiales bacterium]